VTDKIQITIDGQEVEVERGATILQAAQAAGIEIPVLCYFEHTTSNGLCRLCVVETEGGRGMQASCVAEARDDSVVHTNTENVRRARRTILEMLAYSVDLSESPELLGMLREYGADPDRFQGGAKRELPLYDDNPMYIRDYSQCVLCWRCVQVCAEDAQYTFALNFSGRGFDTKIGTFFEKPIPETTCVFCGQCIGVCPTGAIKGKQEHLLEFGYSSQEIFEQTHRKRKQRSKKSQSK
jgi:NADH dehydrogenase/NADH:ubiquinone oxidoreductase subunit G